MATRREFMMAAAAAAVTPSLAHAATPGLGRWLAQQDIGAVYLVHARAESMGSAEVVLTGIQNAIQLDAPRFEQRYGSGRIGELRSLDYLGGVHVDLVTDSGRPGIEITFRGKNGSATYVAG